MERKKAPTVARCAPLSGRCIVYKRGLILPGWAALLSQIQMEVR
jgi:hypothetical protein